MFGGTCIRTYCIVVFCRISSLLQQHSWEPVVTYVCTLLYLGSGEKAENRHDPQFGFQQKGYRMYDDLPANSGGSWTIREQKQKFLFAPGNRLKLIIRHYHAPIGRLIHRKGLEPTGGAPARIETKLQLSAGGIDYISGTNSQTTYDKARNGPCLNRISNTKITDTTWCFFLHGFELNTLTFRTLDVHNRISQSKSPRYCTQTFSAVLRRSARIYMCFASFGLNYHPYPRVVLDRELLRPRVMPVGALKNDVDGNQSQPCV